MELEALPRPLYGAIEPGGQASRLTEAEPGLERGQNARAPRNERITCCLNRVGKA